MSDPIAPLVPPECDLRGLPFIPLDTVRLLDSDLFALSTGDEFKAAVALWCKSWVQVPASSVPNDDRVLAHLSGAGSRWKKVKAMVMRGWVLCSDGRWYHPVVAEKALEAWAHRQAQRDRAAKRWHPSGNATAHATAHATASPAAHATAMQGTGTGTGTGTGKSNVGLPPDAHPPGTNGHDQLRTRELRKQAVEVLDFLNAKTGRGYKPVPANVDMIVARLKDGATVEDLRAVVAKKCREWSADEKMAEYLRPATLFNRTKFAQYEGELGAANA